MSDRETAVIEPSIGISLNLNNLDIFMTKITAGMKVTIAKNKNIENIIIINSSVTNDSCLRKYILFSIYFSY
jgi:hypothetical protein